MYPYGPATAGVRGVGVRWGRAGAFHRWKIAGGSGDPAGISSGFDETDGGLIQLLHLLHDWRNLELIHKGKFA